MGQAQTESHLKVVGSAETPTPKKSKNDVGSRAWAEVKRDEARALVRTIDIEYIQLGRRLWDLYNIPVDNNPGNKPVFTLFGYDHFTDFCATEVGLHYRKAYTFRSIYYRLYIELKDMDAALRERIVALGWTKVRGVSRVLTLANAVSWVEYAEAHTAAEIEKTVGTQLEEARKKKAQAEGLSFDAAAVGAGFNEPGETGAPSTKKPSKKGTVSTPDATEAGGADFMPSFDEEHQTEQDNKNEPVFDPSIGELNPRIKRFFYLLDEESELVTKALDLSMQLSGNDKQADNLAMICLEFLATNTAAARPNIQAEFKVNMLAQVEKLLGVELLAIDPKTQQPLYASASLKQKAAELS